MTFNLGTRNLRTQPRILGPCANDRIFNANSIKPYLLLHFKHGNEVTIIVKLLYGTTSSSTSQ